MPRLLRSVRRALSIRRNKQSWQKPEVFFTLLLLDINVDPQGSQFPPLGLNIFFYFLCSDSSRYKIIQQWKNEKQMSTQYTRRYCLLSGLTSSSFKGLRPSLFYHLGKQSYFYTILGHFCEQQAAKQFLLVTSVTLKTT